MVRSILIFLTNVRQLRNLEIQKILAEKRAHLQDQTQFKIEEVFKDEDLDIKEEIEIKEDIAKSGSTTPEYIIID
jgi:hypothetical protein